jgi:hypothetical protein
MKKGIVDPWRVVVPLRSEPEVIRPPEKQKINPSDIDLDAELRITQYYILRSPQGSVRIDSKDIASENDAVKLLVHCFLHLVATPKYAVFFKEAGIGFSTSERQWNAPTTPAAIVKTEDSTLYFAKHTYAEGMLALVSVLNRINRADRSLLRKYGVSTLLR